MSEPEFCGDSVCGMGKIVGKTNFSEQFRWLVGHCKEVGCGPCVVQRTACLVVGPASDGGYASLFDCTTAGRASGSEAALTWGFHGWAGTWCCVFGLARCG